VNYLGFKHAQFSNDTDGYKALLKWLHSFKFKSRDIVIAMEHTGSYSLQFSEWLDKKQITFCLLHPIEVKNACCRGRNKTDKVDAQFIADYAYTMREKLSPSSPEPQIIKKLRSLRNERELAIRTRTSYLNQLASKDDKTSKARMTKMIKTLDNEIALIEKEINEVIKSDNEMKKNYDLLLTVPGIGFVNAVNTIIATANFTRFQTARQYAKFCCISPLSNKSGSSINKGEHVSKRGHNELKSTLTQAAKSAVINYTHFADYFNRKRTEGKSYGCVLNAVKFKLICRMFAVVQRGTAYVDVEKYKA
jgi:transposase